MLQCSDGDPLLVKHPFLLRWAAICPSDCPFARAQMVVFRTRCSRGSGSTVFPSTVPPLVSPFKGRRLQGQPESSRRSTP
jgi:hypothetical protein